MIGEIKRHYRDRTWAIHVPRSLQELRVRANAAIDRLTAERGQAPTVSQLAEHLNVGEEELLDALQSENARSATPLTFEDADDGERTVDVPVIEAGFEVSDARMMLGTALERLPQRERRILELRFTDGLTQSQIATRVGISQMHVSRLLRRSLEQLRELVGEVDLESSPRAERQAGRGGAQWLHRVGATKTPVEPAWLERYGESRHDRGGRHGTRRAVGLVLVLSAAIAAIAWARSAQSAPWRPPSGAVAFTRCRYARTPRSWPGAPACRCRRTAAARAARGSRCTSRSSPRRTGRPRARYCTSGRAGRAASDAIVRRRRDARGDLGPPRPGLRRPAGHGRSQRLDCPEPTCRRSPRRRRPAR